jgi:hypothetical protein
MYACILTRALAAGCSAAVLVAILSMSKGPLSGRRSRSIGAYMLGHVRMAIVLFNGTSSAYLRLLSFCVW